MEGAVPSGAAIGQLDELANGKPHTPSRYNSPDQILLIFLIGGLVQ